MHVSTMHQQLQTSIALMPHLEEIAKVVIEITLFGWYASAVCVAVEKYEQSGSRELCEI